MQYIRSDNTIICRLEKGEEIISSLLELCEKEQILSASVTGIGATDDFTVGVFEIAKGAYDPIHRTGDHEITALCGNLTRREGKPYAHLHITCAGAGGQPIGGHLVSGTISLTAELFLTVTPIPVSRRFAPEVGINLMAF